MAGARHSAEPDLATTRPGTPGGIFVRQFWHAVYRSQDLPAGYAKPIRIMSEDFALYRGESGRVQIVDYRCPHRGAPLHLGWVEDDAIRCVYHGWKFDCAGQCVDQPAEEAGFARKVSLRTYPTREHLGLIFGYFGSGEPPPFPAFSASPDRRHYPGLERRAGALQLSAELREQHGRGPCRLHPSAGRLARQDGGRSAGHHGTRRPIGACCVSARARPARCARRCITRRT